MEKNNETNPNRALWEQINALWGKMSQITAQITEVNQLIADVSDGMYRRKVRKPKEEETSDYDEIMKLVQGMQGIKQNTQGENV